MVALILLLFRLGLFTFTSPKPPLKTCDAGTARSPGEAYYFFSSSLLPHQPLISCDWDYLAFAGTHGPGLQVAEPGADSGSFLRFECLPLGHPVFAAPSRERAPPPLSRRVILPVQNSVGALGCFQVF